MCSPFSTPVNPTKLHIVSTTIHIFALGVIVENEINLLVSSCEGEVPADEHHLLGWVHSRETRMFEAMEITLLYLISYYE